MVLTVASFADWSFVDIKREVVRQERSVGVLVEVQFVKVVIEEPVDFFRRYHSFVDEDVDESFDLETALVTDFGGGGSVQTGRQESDEGQGGVHADLLDNMLDEGQTV